MTRADTSFVMKRSSGLKQLMTKLEHRTNYIRHRNLNYYDTFNEAKPFNLKVLDVLFSLIYKKRKIGK